MPAAGTFEHAEAMNWLSFVASDLHKSIGGMFSLNAMSSDETVRKGIRKHMVESSNNYLNYMETKLAVL